jgi:predicted Zn-dependent peptidase
MRVRTQVLANGLTVVQIPMPGVVSVAVVAMVGVGSRYDREKEAGLAHFYEHLAVMGTERYPSNLALSQVIEGVGADFNAMTGAEQMIFFIKAEARHWQMAIEMVSELVAKPLLDPKEIEREKLVIIEEINMREDAPDIKVVDRLVEVMFAGNGLGLPTAGTKQTVKSFQRSQLVQLQKDHFVGKNVVLVVAGALEKSDEVLEAIRRSFDGLAVGESTDPDFYVPEEPEVQVEVVDKAIDQVQLAWGFRGVARTHQLRYAQGLLAVILGGGFSSRLFQKVRQDLGLAYSVSAESENFIDTGLLIIDAGVDKLRTNEAVAAVEAELQAVVAGGKPVIGDELRRAKDYLRGKMALRMEDSLSQAMFYGGQQLFDGEINSLEEVLKTVEQVTLDDMQTVAELVLRFGDVSLVAVGKGITEDELKASLDRCVAPKRKLVD